MPTFLWSGKDAEGQQRSVSMPAENAEASKASLLRHGWSELELVREDFGDSEAFRMEPAEWMREEFEKYNTPERQVAFFKGEKPPEGGLMAQWLKGLARMWGAILLSAGILALGIYRHQLPTIITGAALLAVLFLLFPAVDLFFKTFSRTTEDFRQLNRAKVWGRWNEVLECVERLRRADRLTGVAVPEVELVRCRSQALAAQGYLEQGVREYETFASSSKLERWIYLSYLGGIYDCGQEFEKGRELRSEAAKEKPDISPVWIDVAYTCVRRLSHTAEAREALARAETMVISGLGKTYLPFLRGIILWREHKPAEAKEQLEKALQGLQPLAHHTLVEGLILSAKGFLCAVEVQLGNTSKAKVLFAEVEPFLVAHREEELLAACRGVARV